MESIIDIGITGTISALLTIFLYTTAKRNFKITGDNKFKTKGVSALWFVIATIIVGWGVENIPQLLKQYFVYPEVQSIGFILTCGWVCVNFMVDNWNLETPSANNLSELVILIGMLMFIVPFLI